MGHKVRPTSLRLGITETWSSIWYASKKDYARFVVEDYKIRHFIRTKYKFAAISRIEVERTRDNIKVSLHTGRPGIVIGRKGVEIDRLRDRLEDMIGKKVDLNVVEITKPELDAQLVADSVASQLEKRVSGRRAMKRAVASTMQVGAQGVRIRVAGRLGGSDMARVDRIDEGKVPLHTLTADIDYGFTEAVTSCGHVGVKVWIFKGIKLRVKGQANAANA